MIGNESQGGGEQKPEIPAGLSEAEAEALGLTPTPESVEPEAETSPVEEPLAEEVLSEPVAETPVEEVVAEEAELVEELAPVAEEAPAPSEEAAAPAAAEPAPAAGRWYAVRVQSNKEDSVKRNMDRRIEMRGLQRKVSQVVVPTEKYTEIKNGRKRTRQVKTYPGYVLVEMIMDDETWAFVRETGGVGDFVGGGGNLHQKPFPLEQTEVNKIFGIEAPGTEQPQVKIDFSVGDKVKIKEGPFENFDGVVEEIDETKGRVKVVVTIFGRATPVDLQYWQVEEI